jgi:hypothetical protein
MSVLTIRRGYWDSGRPTQQTSSPGIALLRGSGAARDLAGCLQLETGPAAPNCTGRGSLGTAQQ